MWNKILALVKKAGRLKQDTLQTRTPEQPPIAGPEVQPLPPTADGVPTAPRDDRFYTSAIAYVCIFARTPEAAAQNLTRLIVEGHHGFDEGPVAWRDILQTFLDAPDELCRLNELGADFTSAQWMIILEQVRAALLSRLEPGTDITE